MPEDNLEKDCAKNRNNEENERDRETGACSSVRTAELGCWCRLEQYDIIVCERPRES